MFVFDLDQQRPAFEDSLRIWDAPVFSFVQDEQTEPHELLEEFRRAYVNGGAVFARFAVAGDPRIDWYVSRNRLEEIAFAEHLLTSKALAMALPELKPSLPLESIEWVWTTPFILDGEFARTLKAGGAYRDYEGTGVDAKRIGFTACEHLFGNRYDDLLLYRTTTPWSDWFFDIVWDYTWVGVDKATRTVWLICATDTD
jgi:hypothetical protein